MSDRMLRHLSFAVLLAQLVVLVGAPRADAVLEAEARTVHAGAAQEGLHASHDRHDHAACDFCRVLATAGSVGDAPPDPPGYVRDVTSDDEGGTARVVPTDGYLPLGSRAPPSA